MIACSNFNPRAPCGARPLCRPIGIHPAGFQSTRPLRGATCGNFLVSGYLYISIHAPLAGRDAIQYIEIFLVTYFNPRAPCGARRRVLFVSLEMSNFNPRAPCGARPTQCDFIGGLYHISIHAPLAGRDRRSPGHATMINDFNPRAPCGARLPPSRCGWEHR